MCRLTRSRYPSTRGCTSRPGERCSRSTRSITRRSQLPPQPSSPWPGRWTALSKLSSSEQAIRGCWGCSGIPKCLPPRILHTRDCSRLWPSGLGMGAEFSHEHRRRLVRRCPADRPAIPRMVAGLAFGPATISAFEALDAVAPTARVRALTWVTTAQAAGTAAGAAVSGWMTANLGMSAPFAASTVILGTAAGTALVWLARPIVRHPIDH